MSDEIDIGDVPFAHPFFFLRHGETDHNLHRRFQGQFDSELNGTGLNQAHRAASLLADKPIARIVASPLRRARVTAEIVGEKIDLPVETDDALMECHLGIYQDRPYENWMPDYWAGNFSPEGGEDFWQFRARVFPAMQRIVAEAPNTLIVVHGGLWTAARSLIAMSVDLSHMPNALPLHVAPRGGEWDVSVLDEMRQAMGADGA